MHEYVAYVSRTGSGQDPPVRHITVHDLEDPDLVGPEGDVESTERPVLEQWFRERGFAITREILDGRAFRLRRA